MISLCTSPAAYNLEKDTRFFQAPPYYCFQYQSNLSLEAYHTFINWTYGVFDLFLKDSQNEYHYIYFPNGIIEISPFTNGMVVVLIKSKTSEKGQFFLRELFSLLKSSKKIKL